VLFRFQSNYFEAVSHLVSKTVHGTRTAFLVAQKQMIYAGVISRGSGGQRPLVKITVHFGGSASLESLALALLSKCIDLASKMFCIALIKYSLLYGN